MNFNPLAVNVRYLSFQDINFFFGTIHFLFNSFNCFHLCSKPNLDFFLLHNSSGWNLSIGTLCIKVFMNKIYIKVSIFILERLILSPFHRIRCSLMFHLMFYLFDLYTGMFPQSSITWRPTWLKFNTWIITTTWIMDSLFCNHIFRSFRFLGITSESSLLLESWISDFAIISSGALGFLVLPLGLNVT